MSSEIGFRRPVEADHRFLVNIVDDWWGGRKIHALLPRLWFQHFAGTSWIAEDGDRIVGFLVGFMSPDRPDEAYIHMVGTSPNHRGERVGRMLYERFFEDVRSLGARRVTAVTWPGNRTSVAFHRAMGFVPADGPGTQNLYGTPAYADYDADGEDRVVFSREI
ncbi:MAG: GNAT family N-acetyltransferase [Chloroflexota bacterium]